MSDTYMAGDRVRINSNRPAGTPIARNVPIGTAGLVTSVNDLLYTVKFNNGWSYVCPSDWLDRIP